VEEFTGISKSTLIRAKKKLQEKWKSWKDFAGKYSTEENEK
jgi:hypothetical protein